MIVQEQARLILAMAVCGAIMGIVYDVMEITSSLLRWKKGTRAFLDLLFAFLAASAMIYTGLYLRTSPFRLFAFAGAGLGFALYMKLRNTIVRVFRQITYEFVKKS